jgi:hypothetical protein
VHWDAVAEKMKKPNGQLGCKHLVRAASGSLGNFPLTDATGANPLANRASAFRCAHFLQIGEPAPAGPVMGAAGIVAAYLPFSANITYFSHYFLDSGYFQVS